MVGVVSISFLIEMHPRLLGGRRLDIESLAGVAELAFALGESVLEIRTLGTRLVEFLRSAFDSRLELLEQLSLLYDPTPLVQSRIA